MTILLLSNNKFDNFGGYERVLHEILPAINKEFSKIVIFSALHYKTLLTNQNGIPVISSNCEPGPKDIVISGLNGYLFKEGNMQDFVSTLEKVISGKLTFGTPEEIAKTAERFDSDAIAANIINAIKEVISE